MRGHSGSSNFVINPAVSWPGWLMSLTPLVQGFRTLLQNGVSKQEEVGQVTSQNTSSLQRTEKLCSQHGGDTAAVVHLNSHQQITKLLHNQEIKPPSIGGGKQWVEAANGTINHICEGQLAASACAVTTTGCLASLLRITLGQVFPIPGKRSTNASNCIKIL